MRGKKAANFEDLCIVRDPEIGVMDSLTYYVPTKIYKFCSEDELKTIR